MKKEDNMGEWNYPETPKLQKKDSEEFEEWKKSFTVTIDKNYMPRNSNGNNSYTLTPEERAERDIVHKFALSIINGEIGLKSWNIYQSIRLAYLKYIQKGIAARSDFDVSILELR